MATVTQQQLDTFKLQYPNNTDIQALTLAEVQANTADKSIDWALITATPPPTIVSRAAFFPQITPCEKAVAKVIIDVVLIAIGASALSGEINGETVDAVAGAAEEGLVEIEQLAADINNAQTTAEMAKAVFAILSKIYDIGCLGAVISAIFKSLSWWDMILYGIVSIATIVALVATDGVAFIAEVAIILVSGAFLLEDVAACIGICSQPSPGPSPTPTNTAGALRTSNGHYMTVAKGGGLGGDKAALNSDRQAVGPWEIFTIVPIDKGAGTFALKCSNGQYLTASLGGGIGGPDNSNSPCHTDATSIKNYETINFIPQGVSQIAIRTYNQTWITAVNGGGWPDPQNNHPFRTNTAVIGPWETFSLQAIS